MKIIKNMSFRKFRKIALPEEHGSWGFALEPLVLSLLIAYSFSGALVALSAFFLFLAYQPFKIITNPKTNKTLKSNAVKVMTVYAVISISLFIAAFEETTVKNYFPFAAAFVLMFIYLFSDILGKGRTLLTGILAPGGFALISVTILLIDGYDFLTAAGFYVLLLYRIIPTVVFIHERLKISKGIKPNTIRVAVIGIVGIIAVGVLVYAKALPPYSMIAVFILFIRSLIGLTPKMGNISVVKVGILEFIYGALFVAVNYFAYLVWFD